MAATSCLIFLGPETRTPTLDPLISNKSPAKKKGMISIHIGMSHRNIFYGDSR
jgi:hypothetical protein